MSKDQNNKSKNWFARHKILTVIIAVIVLGGIAGAASCGSSETNTTSTTQGTSTPKVEEKTEFAVGETIDIDSKQLTVTNVERNYETGNQFSKPESGNEFVLVTVTIQNNSKSDLMYSTFNFQLQDSNGVKHNEAITALTEGRLNTGTLAPGGKITGKLAYEVPQGDTGLKLVFESGSLFDKTVTVKL
jgi:hypothetical protein